MSARIKIPVVELLRVVKMP